MHQPHRSSFSHLLIPPLCTWISPSAAVNSAHLQHTLTLVCRETWYLGIFSANFHSGLVARSGKLIECILKPCWEYVSSTKSSEKVSAWSCSSQMWHPRLGCDYLSNSCKSGVLRRNEGRQGGNNSPGAKSLWERRKVPTLSQVLSSMQYICFRKTSGSNTGVPNLPNLLLVPGAI